MQGRGIINTLAPRLTRKGIDDHVRRADKTVLHGTGGLDREQFLHQWRLQTAAKVGEDFREHKMLLRAIHLDLSDPAGVHHRQVGPQPATDLFVRAGQLMFQQLQRQQDPRRDGWPSTRGGFGEALGERAIKGCDPGPPRETCRPIGGGDAFRGRSLPPGGMVPVRSASAGGIVRAASLALLIGGRREPQHTTIRYPGQSPRGGNKLVVTI
jgi:hypothetical protein